MGPMEFALVEQQAPEIESHLARRKAERDAESAWYSSPSRQMALIGPSVESVRRSNMRTDRLPLLRQEGGVFDAPATRSDIINARRATAPVSRAVSRGDELARMASERNAIANLDRIRGLKQVAEARRLRSIEEAKAKREALDKVGETLSEAFERAGESFTGVRSGGKTPYQIDQERLSQSDKESDVIFGQILSGLFG